jgi:3-deoxy-manno-octulosonate cytidylyltransferase (CMP-KDO synthetase)
MRILGVIPSRYASTRLPGKPLVDIGGKSMVERVVEQARQCAGLAALVVATDDERVASHVRAFGGEVVMTSPDHPSGTDRCFEALERMGRDRFDAVVKRCISAVPRSPSCAMPEPGPGTPVSGS